VHTCACPITRDSRHHILLRTVHVSTSICVGTQIVHCHLFAIGSNQSNRLRMTRYFVSPPEDWAVNTARRRV
jgi:hypothetical protein